MDKIKIVPVFLRYDYGIKSRGDSLEYEGFYAALKQITNDIHPFWFDDYLHQKDILQKKLITFVNNLKPDIILFILMTDEFSFETLDYLRKKYITINWFGDDQWRFDSFTKDYAPHFTYAITTDELAVSKYKTMGYNNVILSQWASFGFNKIEDVSSIKYKYDVSFIGGVSSYRRWVIKELLKNGIKVECFGNGWENGKVTFNEMKNIFKTSKINLNISNSISYNPRYILSVIYNIKSLYELIMSKKRVEQIKARNFEISAFGGLTNYVQSIEDYFKIKKELEIYSSIDDLVLKIHYYLQNEDERKMIMLKGYKKAIKEHTYLNRLKDIFNVLEVVL